MSPALEALCRAQGLRWLRLDETLRVQAQGGSGPLEAKTGALITDLFAELVGCEDEVRAGFELRFVNRSIEGSLRYFDLVCTEDAEGRVLLVTEVSEQGEVQQRLSQSRNELAIAQARLAESNAALDASRRGLRDLLDDLRIGTALLDADGQVSFLSAAARAFLGEVEGDWRGFGIDAEGLAGIEAALEAPGERIAVQSKGAEGRRFSLEMDAAPTPEGGHRLVFYDVSEVENLQRLLQGPSLSNIVGSSEQMRSLLNRLRNVAPFDTTVLITGETGTGKELVARAIHECSARNDGPFIAMNCAGLSDSLLESQLFGHRKGAFTGAMNDQKGYFESAQGGTLFLDEIGDVPMSVQTRLLRVLQEREVTRVGEMSPRKVDVRFIAATHQDLDALVARGAFRADLMYRIRIARILLPALRERVGDIPELVECFLSDLRGRTGKVVRGFTDEANALLMGYPWPGNVRELRGVAEAGFVQACGVLIEVGDLPPEVQESTPAGPDPFADAPDERARLLAALEAADGNRTRAARLLGISRATFYRRLTELDIEIE